MTQPRRPRPGSRRGPRLGWLGAALVAAAGFLTGVVLIVALGGVVHDHTRYVIHVHTHTSTSTVTETSTRTVTVTPTDPNAVTVPDLVGDALDDAESQLDDLGLEEDDNGGGVFGVVDPSNWQVVGQHPHSGAQVDEGSVVELDVEHD